MTLRETKEEYLKLLAEKDRRTRTRRLYSFYPEEGKLSRHNYPKHMEFFKAGKDNRERALMAANRIGKTEGCTGYEAVLHMLGWYPDWWEGRKYKRPVKVWFAGTTAETTRDILQRKLLGKLEEIGTGLIPFDKIASPPKRDSGIPDAVETFTVKHISGRVSNGQFKAYKQGRKSFEGDDIDIIVLDEEAPIDIYGECVIRTMTTNGMVMMGFTPLEGLSDTVMMFMPSGETVGPEMTGKFLVFATWDDAPHLDEETKKQLWATLPPHQREARSKGIPAIGSGAIYPIAEEDVIVDDFPLPDFHPRAYGFDVGWNNTAAVWRARDIENDISYIYSIYKKGHSEPPVHAEGIKSRGDWINGVADPASRIGSQEDGAKLLDKYIALGLHLSLADNAVETGLYEVWLRLSTGKLKVFRSCSGWFEEFRIYRRDDKGKVVKKFDHYMDCTRYLEMSGKGVEKTMPIKEYIMRNNHQDIYNPLTYGLGAQ